MNAPAHDLFDVSQPYTRSARKIVLRDSTLRDQNNIPIDVVVSDLSTTGFSVVAPLDLEIGAIVRIGLGGAGAASARVIRRAESSYGCQFLQPLGQDRVDAAFKYSEILTAIGAAAPTNINEQDIPYEADRWDRSTRLAVILGAGGAAWAALAIAWYSL